MILALTRGERALSSLLQLGLAMAAPDRSTKFAHFIHARVHTVQSLLLLDILDIPDILDILDIMDMLYMLNTYIIPLCTCYCTW